MELPGVYTERNVLEIVRYCITFYKRNSRDGKRFAEIFKKSDVDALIETLQDD